MTPAEIRDLRKSLGWTNERLAEACGAALRTVYAWQSGERQPSGSALLLLRQLAKS